MYVWAGVVCGCVGVGFGVHVHVLSMTRVPVHIST